MDPVVNHLFHFYFIKALTKTPKNLKIFSQATFFLHGKKNAYVCLNKFRCIKKYLNNLKRFLKTQTI